VTWSLWLKRKPCKQASRRVSNISNYNEGVTTLSDIAKVNVNVNNDDRVDSDHRKQLDQAIRNDEINHCRTSNRQRKVPVTRKDDFLWQIPYRR
jgi:hypothetical protein